LKLFIKILNLTDSKLKVWYRFTNSFSGMRKNIS